VGAVDKEEAVMASSDQPAGGSAAVHGQLWGVRLRDWVEVQEGVARPLYEEVLRQTRVGPGVAYLDVGCGAGLACQMAAALGATVTGLDASASFISAASERVPQGHFQVGEMEHLPYPEHSFHVVNGFYLFQDAATPENALREARRVARPGAPVVVATWGLPEDCQAVATQTAVSRLLPPPPPGAPGPFALSDEQALKALAAQAGLTPALVADIACPFLYPDLETALRGLLSAGPIVRAMEQVGEASVRAAVANALAPFALPEGGYRLENKFRYVIATA